MSRATRELAAARLEAIKNIRPFQAFPGVNLRFEAETGDYVIELGLLVHGGLTLVTPDGKPQPKVTPVTVRELGRIGHFDLAQALAAGPTSAPEPPPQEPPT